MKKKRSRSLPDEGVTRYRLEFRKSAPVAASFIREIDAWRSLLHSLGWIGQDPWRYKGAGFGNISRRLERGSKRRPSFVVSGTQTGHLIHLSARGYSIVRTCEPEKNFVAATGPVPPSSESMTHAAIYALDPSARVVIHVHAPLLWKNARRLRLPVTSAAVAYGTPEMAREVARLFRRTRLRREKIFSMAGHRDGLIAYGRTADEAGWRLLTTALAAHGAFRRPHFLSSAHASSK